MARKARKGRVELARLSAKHGCNEVKSSLLDHSTKRETRRSGVSGLHHHPPGSSARRWNFGADAVAAGEAPVGSAFHVTGVPATQWVVSIIRS